MNTLVIRVHGHAGADSSAVIEALSIARDRLMAGDVCGEVQTGGVGLAFEWGGGNDGACVMRETKRVSMAARARDAVRQVLNGTSYLMNRGIAKIQARRRARLPVVSMSSLEAESEEVMDDDEVDQMHAWSISARLAALPASDVGRLPEHVASLVSEAKGLHPAMARR